MKDTEIIHKIKQGDTSVLNHVHKLCFNICNQFIRRNNGYLQDAEDIAQEVMVALWNKASNPEFKLTCKLSTYIYSICYNLWLKKLYKQNKVPISGSELLMYENLVSDRNDENEDNFDYLTNSLDKLLPNHKEIIILYYFENKNFEEISTILNYKSPDTVKTLKSRAIKNLSKILKI